MSATDVYHQTTQSIPITQIPNPFSTLFLETHSSLVDLAYFIISLMHQELEEPIKN
jgi:hypothetical protein